MDRFFDYFQLAALACLACLGIGRAVALYARGVRVVVVDRQRSLAQALEDLLFVACFVLWLFETVAHTWPLPIHLVPPPLRAVFVDAVMARVVGAAMVIAGLAVYGLALRSLGNSWRLGIDRDTPGALVTDGVFAWTRNPIYVGLDLVFIGTSLLQGRLIFLALALAMVAMTHDQIRREERFLAQTYADAYTDYCARVGRYLTWR